MARAKKNFFLNDLPLCTATDCDGGGGDDGGGGFRNRRKSRILKSDC